MWLFCLINWLLVVITNIQWHEYCILYRNQMFCFFLNFGIQTKCVLFKHIYKPFRKKLAKFMSKLNLSDNFCQSNEYKLNQLAFSFKNRLSDEVAWRKNVPRIFINQISTPRIKTLTMCWCESISYDSLKNQFWKWQFSFQTNLSKWFYCHWNGEKRK